jgi:hypothetical protein
MKKTTSKITTAPTARIYIDREDRARTNAGKTVNSKVRSQGRTLAAMERAATTARTFQAEEVKSSNR